MYKMLIADDERIVREAVAELIDWESMDIEIVGLCRNGLEALDVIMDTAPDIVMTDIKMPGMDGLELIGKIHQIDQRIQFIILSGYQEFEFAKKAMQFGVRHYLLKPINEKQIIDAVQQIKQNFDDLQPPVERLAAQLVQAHRQNDRPAAQKLLDEFFASAPTVQICRSQGVMLVTSLRSRLNCVDSGNILKFLDQLFENQPLQAVCDSLKAQILSMIFSETQENLSLSDEDKLYVRDHLDDPELSLKYIAENYLFMNVDYLSRCFTRQAGEKFSSYLNRTRIERAKTLLRSLGAGSVHTVAEQIGCGNNPQYFSQIFKKYTGLTPTQFIEQDTDAKKPALSM